MHLDRPVRLHPLNFLAEDGEVVVGRTDIDSYAVFPSDGAALLQRLAGGAALGDAAEWYAQTYGETVDMTDFLTTLHELDFVDDVTGPAAAADNPQPSGPLRWQRLGRAAFSPVAWVGYAMIVAAVTVLCLNDHSLLPHRDHAFFVQYLIIIELTVALGQVPLILVHECFHVLAARRLGIPARIRVSHRLYFVVFETVMDGLVLVPRRRRYLPMLAGMLADVLVTALLTIAAWAVRDIGGPQTVTGACLALALTTVVRLAFEFLLFLRTDIYYLAATLSDCVDLHTTCREMVRNCLWRLLGRDNRLIDPERWHPNDVRAARWYMPLYLAGYGVAIGLLAVLLLPITWRFLYTAATAVWHHDLGSAHFWDAAALLVLNGAQPAVAGLVALREHALQKHAERRRDRRVAAASLTAPSESSTMETT